MSTSKKTASQSPLKTYATGRPRRKTMGRSLPTFPRPQRKSKGFLRTAALHAHREQGDSCARFPPPQPIDLQ